MNTVTILMLIIVAIMIIGNYFKLTTLQRGILCLIQLIIFIIQVYLAFFAQ